MADAPTAVTVQVWERLGVWVGCCLSAWGSQEKSGTSKKWGLELELEGENLWGLCIYVGYREKVW